MIRYVLPVLWMTSYLLIKWAAVSAAYSALLSSSYFERINDDDDDDDKPRLLDDAAQLKRGAHAALGLAINCAQ